MLACLQRSICHQKHILLCRPTIQKVKADVGALQALPLQTARQSAFVHREEPANSSAQQGTGPVSALEELIKGGARLTRAAHLLWAQVVRPGDFVVDATSGNGGDALWLARAVGPSGRLLAIDIQEAAIQSTRDLLDWELPSEAYPELRLVQDCHTRIKEHVGGDKAKLICFNLGYLPYGDKQRMTKPSTTVAALEAALDCLQDSGALSVISYIGHEGGIDEHEAVHKLLAGLDPHTWMVCTSRILNRPMAPILTFAMRIRP